ncbi:chitin-binding domain protein cbd-1 isoform X2 [Solenopsis invicta]|uniref:chitin-binding domain protein cbd-1 isoform X2 n=1 Tax=Solenopsis invicta TaxID=13686 RepID=UPI000E33D54A|nr:chitin-binding domain protein cbd-1 isoform X2 [Solenopsis invicta]
MRRFAIAIILQVSLRISALYTIECPIELQKDIVKYSEKTKPLQVSCTMQLLCLSEDLTNHENRNRRYQVHEYDPDDKAMCEVKLKINIARNLSAIETKEENPCARLAHHEHSKLLPHSTNCSLFYKCNWGVPMLFECPKELHFNPVLQVCDWPWQAGCNSTWIGCPRPFPRCPSYYPGPLLVPHPFLCDRFYQCNWGTLRLRKCPNGLYFDSHLKVCDWPYNSNCQIC